MNILRKDPGLPTDSFYEVRAGFSDGPKTNFRIKVKPFLHFKDRINFVSQLTQLGNCPIERSYIGEILAFCSV